MTTKTNTAKTETTAWHVAEALLSAADPMTVTDLVNETGRSKTGVRNALNALAADGFARKGFVRGTWEVVPVDETEDEPVAPREGTKLAALLDALRSGVVNVKDTTTRSAKESYSRAQIGYLRAKGWKIVNVERGSNEFTLAV